MITKKIEKKAVPELRIVVTLDFAQIPAAATPEAVLAEIPKKFEQQVEFIGEYEGEDVLDQLTPDSADTKLPFPAFVGYTIDVVTP